jgi:hypothetical protein
LDLLAEFRFKPAYLASDHVDPGRTEAVLHVGHERLELLPQLRPRVVVQFEIERE